MKRIWARLSSRIRKKSLQADSAEGQIKMSDWAWRRVVWGISWLQTWTVNVIHLKRKTELCRDRPLKSCERVHYSERHEWGKVTRCPPTRREGEVPNSVLIHRIGAKKSSKTWKSWETWSILTNGTTFQLSFAMQLWGYLTSTTRWPRELWTRISYFKTSFHPWTILTLNSKAPSSSNSTKWVLRLTVKSPSHSRKQPKIRKKPKLSLS